MTCRLFGSKPLFGPTLVYFQLDLEIYISMKFYLNIKIFHSRKFIWKCRLQNVGHFFSRPKCINYLFIKCHRKGVHIGMHLTLVSKLYVWSTIIPQCCCLRSALVAWTRCNYIGVIYASMELKHTHTQNTRKPIFHYQGWVQKLSRTTRKLIICLFWCGKSRRNYTKTQLVAEYGILDNLCVIYSLEKSDFCAFALFSTI